jgi:DNA repair and recombination protein RAD52
MKDWSELERLCAEPLDRANVKERRQAGSVLSYVDGYYVKRRLSEVFGVAGWSSSVTVLAQEGPAYEAKSRSGNVTQRVAYRCEVALTVRGRTGGVGGDPVRVLEVTKTDVGTGLGSAADLNEAREKAMKEAATDALKRAAALLGDSFGLALYDKAQANVEDARQRQQRAALERAAVQLEDALKTAPDKAAKAEVWEAAHPDVQRRVREMKEQAGA